MRLMEKIVSRANHDGGLTTGDGKQRSCGIERTSVEQLQAYLKEHWLRIREELLACRTNIPLLRQTSGETAI